MSDLTPVDYSIPSPVTALQSAMGGYSAGAAIRNDQQAQQQQQLQLQQQQQQAQVIGNLIRNPTATANDYANAALLVPGMKDQLKQAWDTKNTAQQQSQLSDLSQWSAAIQNGQPQIAVDAMNARADAMEQAAGGPTQESQLTRAHAQAISIHPALARYVINSMLAFAPGGDKVVDNLARLGGEQRATDQAPGALIKVNADASKAATEAGVASATAPAAIAKPTLENQNLQGQITDRVKRFALDQDKLTTDTQLALKKMGLEYGQLPTAVGEQVTAAVTDSVAAEQSATRMADLATRLEKEGGGFGAFSSASEWLKGATGNQNEMTRIRAEYSRIVTPASLAAYKKVASGSTSDKDIETAMTGVPPSTADATTMASFLRGAAKLQVYESVLNDAKSQWLGANRNLGKSNGDQTINGVQIPAGTTFKDFIDQYVPTQVAGKLGALTLQGRDYYTKFANPQSAEPGQ